MKNQVKRTAAKVIFAAIMVVTSSSLIFAHPVVPVKSNKAYSSQLQDSTKKKDWKKDRKGKAKRDTTLNDSTRTKM